MRENTMKKKLGAGQPVFGSMITFPSPVVVEMLGYLGYDWVLIDNEHGSITIDLAEDMIRAAEYSGTAPIVRPVGNRPEIIAPFLDRGAWGVQVPTSIPPTRPGPPWPPSSTIRTVIAVCSAAVARPSTVSAEPRPTTWWTPIATRWSA